jgi:hypothetical protein
VVNLSNTSLTFAPQALTTFSADQQLSLTNSGDANLVISAMHLTGDFEESTTCVTQAPASSCQISIRFSPTAVGDRTGVLSIVDNAAGSPHTVNLSGQGVGPSLGLIVPQGSSGAAIVAAGTSAKYGLSIGGAGMSGMASLTCAGAPRGAVCTLPISLTVDTNNPLLFSVAVSTTSRTMAAVRASRLGWFWAMAILGLAVLPWSQSTRKTANRCLPLAMVAAVFLSSCGGGSGSDNGPQLNPNGTPAGTYTLTVTATVGSNVQSTSLTLTVQ